MISPLKIKTTQDSAFIVQSLSDITTKFIKKFKYSAVRNGQQKKNKSAAAEEHI